MHARRFRLTAISGALAVAAAGYAIASPGAGAAAAGGPTVAQIKNTYEVLKLQRNATQDTPPASLRSLVGSNPPPVSSWRRMAANYPDSTGGVKRAWLGVKRGQLCYIVTSRRPDIEPTGRCIALTKTSQSTDTPIVIGLGADTSDDGLHQRNRIAAIVPTGVTTVKIVEGDSTRYIAVKKNLATARYTDPACVTVEQDLRTVRLAGNSCSSS